METQDGQGVWAVPLGPQTLEKEGIPDCGVREDRQEVVEIDASLSGLGAVWQCRTVRGQWDAQQSI